MPTVTLYGGTPGHDADTGQIGGNKILLEWDDRAYFLDFGTNFAVTGRFYEEFLRPRGSTVGLRDFLRMGLIPPLEGIYRDDLWAHEPDVWERYRSHPRYRRVERLDGVLLSHAHVDHSGCLGFLKPEIPVYTGLMTATITKGIQDCRSGGPDAEYSYIQPREVKDDVLKAIGRAPRRGRQHFICQTDEDITDAQAQLQAFWADHPGAKTEIEAPPLATVDPASLGLRFFRVDHSIPGSAAFALETPIGWIVYSGDLRLHGHSKWRTELFAKEAAKLKPAVFIVEGTHLDRQTSVEEPEVHQAAADVVAGASGLVIADFSPRNIERLRTFHDVAAAQGRKLVVTTRDAYLLVRMHVIDPAIPTPDEDMVMVLEEPAGIRQGWEKYVLERFASSVVDARDIRADPAGHILCLSFFDISNLIDLEPEDGTYIYSSSEAYNEEQLFDQVRLGNWLSHFGMTPVGGLPGVEEGPFHASGHIDGPGMEWLIETIDPEKIVPVHTQQLGWFEERWGEKAVVGRYGEPVRLGE